jgi:hypothetical protein
MTAIEIIDAIEHGNWNVLDRAQIRGRWTCNICGGTCYGEDSAYRGYDYANQQWIEYAAGMLVQRQS